MRTIRHLLKIACMLLGATTFLLAAWARNQATLTPIGRWPEYPLMGGRVGVRVAGSYAYVAGDGYPIPTGHQTRPLRLLTLDISTPSQPRYLSHLDIPTTFEGWYYRMELRGNYLYMTQCDATSASLLAVVSLSQPMAPQLVASYPFAGAAYDLEVVGNRAYVAGFDIDADASFLTLINVTDPAHPVPDATVWTWRSDNCAVAGDYAYVAGYVGPQLGDRTAHVDIIDVADPSQADVVGGFDIPDYSGVQAIAAQGALLHLAAQNAYLVYDLTDPLNPSLLTRYELPTEVVGIRVVGNLVYCWTYKGLRIIDLTDPLNPQVQSFVPLRQGGFMCDTFDIAGQSAFWESADELSVLDVKDPSNPIQVGQFDTGFSEDVRHGFPMCVQDDLIYLLEPRSRRLRILDVNNPRAPTLVGAKDLDSAGPFKVVGQRGYLLVDASLQVLDLSNPAQPMEVGRLATSTSNAGVDVVGPRGYVTGSITETNHCLTVIDIANPA